MRKQGTANRNSMSSEYEGFVVSDYDAWANIYSTHKFSPDMEGAAADGINAGIDQEGGGTQAIEQLANAVRDGKTTAKAVETSFRRLMLARIRLGMFDPPSEVSYNNIFYNATELTQNEEHNSINRRASEESMTLLKNSNTLPLSLENINTLGLLVSRAILLGSCRGTAGSANKGTV